MYAALWRFVEIILMMEDNSPSAVKQRAWRMAVAMSILFLLAQVAASYGLFRFAGVDGFAQARDITDIRTRTSDIQDRLLQKSIIDVRIQQCTATSKRFFSDRLRELTDEYYATNKRSFDLPTCEALN